MGNNHQKLTSASEYLEHRVKYLGEMREDAHRRADEYLSHAEESLKQVIEIGRNIVEIEAAITRLSPDPFDRLFK